MRLPSFLSARTKPKPQALPPVPYPPTDLDEKDEEDDAPLSDERRRHILAVWLNLKEDSDARIVHLTDLLAEGPDEGGIDAAEWAAQFRTLMTRTYAHAHMVGRNLAGDLGPLGTHDTDAGAAEWERQEQYFTGFEKAIADGKYTKADGSLDTRPFLARERAYLAAKKGAATEAFRVAMGDDPLNWVLGDSDHCKQSPNYPYNCPDLSESGPKPASEWETAPGRMDTPCGNNCTCSLSSSPNPIWSTQGL